ncbi:hypothetical protein [Sphingomonas sp.]|uniref:hypothetical protein n=1 Tax=Sphingomonas sp. TaxID=28214 RepID=UPI0035C7FC83
MSLDGYKECSKLAEIADHVAQVVTETGKPWVANLCVKVSFPAKLLSKPELLDAAERAKLWQSVATPKELHFSHGQFLGDEGITHVADELKRKPDSNRALASLISTRDILRSGDEPLPSFLTFQCMIDGTTLYVTVAYRAMEVTDFFRINLEEIRMMAFQVYRRNNTVEEVALCLFVTRAYAKKGMNPLERCEIDRIDQVDLLDLHRSRLPELLREKARHSTYPDEQGLRQLLAVAGEQRRPEYRLPGASPVLKANLEEAVADTLKLKELRKSASHHRQISELETDLKTRIEKIADMIEEALARQPR